MEPEERGGLREEHVGDGVSDDRSRTRGGHRRRECACRVTPPRCGRNYVMAYVTFFGP